MSNRLIEGYLLSAVVLAQSWVGLTWDEAKWQALNQGVLIRVVEREGEPMAITMDHVAGRVNVTLKDNVVIGVRIEGQP